MRRVTRFAVAFGLAFGSNTQGSERYHSHCVWREGPHIRLDYVDDDDEEEDEFGRSPCCI